MNDVVVFKVGVITTSDRAAAGVYVDEGTPEVVGVLRQQSMSWSLQRGMGLGLGIG